MMYYPEDKKYAVVDIDNHDSRGVVDHYKSNLKSDHWRLSIALAWATAAHVYVVSLAGLSD